MYNRYLTENNQYIEEIDPVPESEPHRADRPQPTDPPEHGASSSGGGLLSSLLGKLEGKIHLPQLNMETLVLLVVLYFLLDESDDTEMWIIVAVLLVLGM